MQDWSAPSWAWPSLAIVLLTFAPIIAGDINAIALQSTGHCVISNGELVDRVLSIGTHTTSNEAWAADGASNEKITNDSDDCLIRSGFVDSSISKAGLAVDTTRGRRWY